MTHKIHKVKGQLYCDIIMFCTITFQAIIQLHKSGTEGETVTTFHMWSDTELVTLIFGAHLETVLSVWILCAARLKMCVKDLHFRTFSFFAATFIVVSVVLLCVKKKSLCGQHVFLLEMIFWNYSDIHNNCFIKESGHVKNRLSVL